MELLATLNRVVYFLNQIHQDNERVSLAMSAAALRLTAPDNTTDTNYYTPIGRWVTNKCWNDTDRGECQNLDTTTSAASQLIE